MLTPKSVLINRLDQLESTFQHLIEGSLVVVPPGWSVPCDLGSRLVDAMITGLHQRENGELVAPDVFILYFHPQQASFIRQDIAFLNQLAELLREAANKACVDITNPVIVRIVDDLKIEFGEVRVMTEFSSIDLVETAAVILSTETPKPDEPVKDISEPLYPVRAFLIVDGTKIYPLSQAVINIGRSPENHLVLDDGRVSRLHAQLRRFRGRYKLFDLGSTGGTWVNGRRVNQSTLSPGDVISLAGVPMVYGLDSQLQEGTTQEYPAGALEND